LIINVGQFRGISITDTHDFTPHEDMTPENSLVAQAFFDTASKHFMCAVPVAALANFEMPDHPPMTTATHFNNGAPKSSTSKKKGHYWDGIYKNKWGGCVGEILFYRSINVLFGGKEE
jgi:hypothetical protein